MKSSSRSNRKEKERRSREKRGRPIITTSSAATGPITTPRLEVK
jgi:hypothetical protein